MSFHLINLSTYQPINLSTYQPINLSTYQPINLSTYQPINLSTYQPINLSTSNAHFAADVRMRIVILQGEVLVAEREDVLHLGIDSHGGQGPRLARELQAHLVQVILVDVCIAKGVHELARLQAAHLRHHHRQQRIAGNVEGHAQENVGRALVELTRKPPLRGCSVDRLIG